MRRRHYIDEIAHLEFTSQALVRLERRVRHDHKSHVATLIEHQPEAPQQDFDALIRGEVPREDERPHAAVLSRSAASEVEALRLHAARDHGDAFGVGAGAAQQDGSDWFGHGDDLVRSPREGDVEPTTQRSAEPHRHAGSIERKLRLEQGVRVVQDRQAGVAARVQGGQ